MARFIFLFVILSFSFILTGCGTVTASSSGEISPILDQPLPKNSRILVISTMNGDIKSYNGFSDRIDYQGNPASMNQTVNQAVRAVLQNSGYQTIGFKLPASNPLNEDDIESAARVWTTGLLAGGVGAFPLLRGSLTTESKDYLRALLYRNQIDYVLLVTNDYGKHQTFYIDCGESMYGSSSGTFKVFVINASDLSIMGWEAGEIQFKTAACLNTHRLTLQQLITLENNMINPMTNAIVDTSRNMLLI